MFAQSNAIVPHWAGPRGACATATGGWAVAASRSVPPPAWDGNFQSASSGAEADAEGSADVVVGSGATIDVTDDTTVRPASADAVGALCEAIRARLAAWVPGTLGVHVRRHPYAPETIALLLDAVAGAATCTGLAGPIR